MPVNIVPGSAWNFFRDSCGGVRHLRSYEEAWNYVSFLNHSIMMEVEGGTRAEKIEELVKGFVGPKFCAVYLEMDLCWLELSGGHLCIDEGYVKTMLKGYCPGVRDRAGKFFVVHIEFEKIEGLSVKDMKEFVRECTTVYDDMDEFFKRKIKEEEEASLLLVKGAGAGTVEKVEKEEGKKKRKRDDDEDDTETEGEEEEDDDEEDEEPVEDDYEYIRDDGLVFMQLVVRVEHVACSMDRD